MMRGGEDGSESASGSRHRAESRRSQSADAAGGRTFCRRRGQPTRGCCSCVLRDAGIDIIAVDSTRSREVYVQVKTRTDSRFVWHIQVPGERVLESRDEREFYVFVDLGTGANALPGYWIAPRSWVQNMIYDHKQARLKKRGNSARNPDAKHSGIKTEQLERWKDRWDVLRVGLK